MPFQICQQHGSDEIAGRKIAEPPGAFEYTCPRADHLVRGPLVWIEDPTLASLPGLSDVALFYRLDHELPAALAAFDGRWVEYGVLERAYAQRCPHDFAALVAKYGHREVAPKEYTVSAFLAGTLGRLGRMSAVQYHSGPATGRWSYLPEVSWWAAVPAGDWDEGLSWAAAGGDTSYIPGAPEPYRC
jgi:hypothetical protein